MGNFMDKRQRKYLLYLAIIAIAALLVLYFSFKEDSASIMRTLRQLRIEYLLICIGIILVYHFVVGYILRLFALFYKKDYSIKEGFINALIAALFHGLTPFASGGQFIQGYVFYKQGIDVGESASILLMDFIVYQTTMVFYTLVFILLKYTTYFKVNSSLFTLALLGFLVSFVVILGLWALARWHKLHTWLTNRGIYWLAKWKIVKNPEDLIARLNAYLEKFNREVARLSNRKELITKVVLANILRLTLYYMMPFLCAKALQIDIPIAYLIDMIALSSFVSMVNAFIPLPGASGGTEGTFTVMFSGLMSRENVISTMLLWRFVTYYFILFVGAFVFAKFNKDEPIRKIEEELYENRVVQ